MIYELCYPGIAHLPLQGLARRLVDTSGTWKYLRFAHGVAADMGSRQPAPFINSALVV